MASSDEQQPPLPPPPPPPPPLMGQQHGRLERHGSLAPDAPAPLPGPAPASSAVPGAAYDPYSDPLVRSLLQQMNDLQAKLASLLPTRYGTAIGPELDMLRHKHRGLQAYADQHRKRRSLSPFSFRSFCVSVCVFRTRRVLSADLDPTFSFMWPHVT